ncbi:MAG TPA: hypothetical protein VN838_28675 [Bradyrhizobium sp.]|nr:hypothetical protein [Bradyrhizobium sp.]
MALILPAQPVAFNAWPDVNPGQKPIRSWVICQKKLVPRVSKGGIVYSDQTREDEMFGMTGARVVAIGPLAFKDANTGAELPGAPWYKVGDFVRIPVTGLRQWKVKTEDHGEVIFVLMQDVHVQAMDLVEEAEYLEKWAPK